MKESDLELYVRAYLETGTFEEMLEQFNVSCEEAFICLFENGLIDEELLEEIRIL